MIYASEARLLKPFHASLFRCLFHLLLLPPLPPAPVPRRAAGRARRGTELGTGLTGVGGLDDFASLAERLFR